MVHILALDAIYDFFGIFGLGVYKLNVSWEPFFNTKLI
jgi:hypothetical protein